MDNIEPLVKSIQTLENYITRQNIHINSLTQALVSCQEFLVKAHTFQPNSSLQTQIQMIAKALKDIQ